MLGRNHQIKSWGYVGLHVAPLLSWPLCMTSLQVLWDMDGPSQLLSATGFAKGDQDLTFQGRVRSPCSILHLEKKRRIKFGSHDFGRNFESIVRESVVWKDWDLHFWHVSSNCVIPVFTSRVRVALRFPLLVQVLHTWYSRKRPPRNSTLLNIIGCP